MTALLTPADIPSAADLLRAGKLVAFGTETVYGLGADATNAEAVAGIFEAKGRPHFNPLICHYANPEDVFAHVLAPGIAMTLAARFWPGPLTLVLPRRPGCPVAQLAGAGLETLAVRIPAHPTALALIEAMGRPIAAPSANRSGRISPTTAAHVLSQLSGRIAAIIDSGPCTIGVESTVLDLSGAHSVLLRPGGVSIEALESAIGPIGRQLPPAAAESSRSLRSPGMLLSHYAPNLPVRLNVTSIAPHEALLAFGPAFDAALTYQLSETRNLTEAAARLFEALHWLDANATPHGLNQIAVMPIPLTGLGLAINDRLTRAAAAKDSR
jgi:L-threonylcarbamoyladenylate synthase